MLLKVTILTLCSWSILPFTVQAYNGPSSLNEPFSQQSPFQHQTDPVRPTSTSVRRVGPMDELPNENEGGGKFVGLGISLKAAPVSDAVWFMLLLVIFVEFIRDKRKSLKNEKYETN